MRKHLTIRIVDDRQSRKPAFWKAIADFWKALFILSVVPSVVFWPGFLADSAPMQWAGLILFIICSYIFLGRWHDQFKSVDEARQRLEEIAASQGKDQ